MSRAEAEANLKFLNSAWQLSEDGRKLKRQYKFPDFISALKFVNEVGRIAESEGHHPNIYLTWGKAEIEIYTHAVGGLTENDFILASKIDALSSSPYMSVTDDSPSGDNNRARRRQK